MSGENRGLLHYVTKKKPGLKREAQEPAGQTKSLRRGRYGRDLPASRASKTEKSPTVLGRALGA